MSLAPILMALQQPEARVAMEVDLSATPPTTESGIGMWPWVVGLLAAAAVVTLKLLWRA